MDNEMRWDLTKLYPSFESKEFAGDNERLEQIIAETAGWADAALGEADDASKNLKHIVKTDEQITRLIARIESYAMLTLSVEATNETAQRALDNIERIEVDARNLRSRFTRYIGALKNLDEVIETTAELKPFAFYLHEHAQNAQYLLAPEIEPVVAKMEVTGSKAWARLRNMIDATMMVDVKRDEETEKLPLSKVRNMAYSDDAAERKLGYESELNAYPLVELSLSHAMSAIKGEGLATGEMRGYESILDRSLIDSRMKCETLDAMIAAMEEAMPDFRRYLRAKAKVLGHKGGLPFYDLFAPLTAGEGSKYTYTQAQALLEEVFSGFTPELSAFVKNAFAQRWVDAEPREGKGGGAFCDNLVMIKESRVLSNFDGSLPQVSTLAHELGHAWHGHCLKDTPMLKADYPMPLAETASIFNEGLLMESVMGSAEEEEKFALLDMELMEYTQIIVDIYSRFLFEKSVIGLRKDHGVSADEMKSEMQKAQTAAYGDGLDAETMHPYMWACKPHYYFPEFAYYNWPYAFGLLFGKGLFAIYKMSSDGFVEKYNDMLAASGSGTVEDVAALMGIDVTDKRFWQQSLGEIVEAIDVFCGLAEKRAGK